MNAEELTKLYSPSQWVPGRSSQSVLEEFLAGNKKAFEDVANDESLEKQMDVDYGKDERHKIDIIGKVCTHLCIFIHGGYWTYLTRKDMYQPCRLVVKNGYAFASIGYRLASHVNPLSQTVQDCIEAVQFLLDKYPHVQKVVIAGHSAGAHLAFHVATNIRDNRVRGLLLFSGVYFLKELPFCEPGQDISLTEAEAEKNSCDVERLKRLITIKTHVVLGLNEAPKLIEQNRKVAATHGLNVTMKEIPNESHFSIITGLMDGTTESAKSMVDFLKMIY